MSPQSMRDAAFKSSRDRIEAVEEDTFAKEPFSSRSPSQRDRASK